MKRTHRLLNRGIRVEPMALEHVDIVHLQPIQARLDRLENVLSREAAVVDITIVLWIVACLDRGVPWRNREVDLGKDHKRRPRGSYLLDRFAQYPFRFS